MELNINAYSRITNQGVWVNGKEIPILNANENAPFLDNIYRTLGMEYLKFFKMDKLSKAGLLGAELVMNASKIERDIPKQDHALICFNRSSSLHNDTLYQQTIHDESNYFPSPSVFVYTLANIVAGEIAIRNKIQGETSFYLTEKFSPEQLYFSILDAFNNSAISALLCGWIDYHEDVCDVAMLYVSEAAGERLSVDNLKYYFH